MAIRDIYNPKNQVLFLFGEITFESYKKTCEETVKALYNEKIENIVPEICSSGGQVNPVLYLFNLIQSSPKPIFGLVVNMRIFGYSYSAGLSAKDSWAEASIRIHDMSTQIRHPLNID